MDYGKFSVTAFAPLIESGNSFSEKLQTSAINYSLSTARGFSTARFQLKGSLDYLLDWFTSGLARHITIRAPDTFLAWEGYVTKLTLAYGGFQLSASLDTMANYIYVTYTQLDTTMNPPTETANQVVTASDSLSITRYGQKEQIINGGKATATNAQTLARVALYQSKDPDVSQVQRSLQGNAGTLSVECRGYGFTLDWYTYEQVSTSGTGTASSIISTIVAADPNSFISTNSPHFGTLSTLTEAYWKRSTAGSIIKKIVARGAESGSVGIPWVAMVLDDRELHLKAAEGVNVETGVQDSTNLKSLLFRNINGSVVSYSNENDQVIPPWQIRPDSIVFTPSTGLYQYVSAVNLTEPAMLTLQGGTVPVSLQTLTNTGII